jgi:uncharacterized protein involved in type VI secretion and phage assembly
VIQRADGDGPRFYGLYPAIVTNIVDEKNLGRIEVSFPWLGTDGASVRAWATLLSPYAEDGQGFLVCPSKDTQVVVAFEAGDPRRPYIVGTAWNGREALPVLPEEANNYRLIRTRSGCILEFDDTDGAVKITIETPGGHKIVLDDGQTEVKIEHSAGPFVKLTSGGEVKIQANSTVDITASALNVHAASAVFDGSITCTSVTASSSTTSPSYTPGAGNVW